jgi:hypothetical protein
MKREEEWRKLGETANREVWGKMLDDLLFLEEPQQASGSQGPADPLGPGKFS